MRSSKSKYLYYQICSVFIVFARMKLVSTLVSVASCSLSPAEFDSNNGE